MDNTIHPDKLPDNKVIKAETTTHTADLNKSIPVGQLLHNAVKSLPHQGLESINVVKAMQSLKGLFPSEFTQIQIQERQAQIDKPVTTKTTFTPVSEATKNAWHNGQTLHAKVLKTETGGTTTLLINKQTVEVKIDNPSQLKLEAGQNLALTVQKNTNSKLQLVLSTSPEQSAKLIQLIQNMLGKQQAMPPMLASLDSIVKHINADPGSGKINTSEKINPEKTVLDTPALKKAEPEKSTSVAQTAEPKTADPKRTEPMIASSSTTESKTTTTTTASVNENQPAATTKTQTATNIKIPEAVIKAIQQLVNQFSTSQQLSISEGLKQAVNNSGIFLENRIQFQKTDSSILANRLSNSIEKIEQFSQQLGTRINQKISLPVETIQTFEKSVQRISQSIISLKTEPVQAAKAEVASLISTIKNLLERNNISPQLKAETGINSVTDSRVVTRSEQSAEPKAEARVEQVVRPIAERTEQRVEQTSSQVNQSKLTNEQIKQLVSEIKQAAVESQKIAITPETADKIKQDSVNAKDIIRILQAAKEQLEQTNIQLNKENIKQLANLLQNISQEAVKSAAPIIKPEILTLLKQPVSDTINGMQQRFELLMQLLENKKGSNLLLTNNTQLNQIIVNKFVQNLAPQLKLLLASPFGQTINSQQQFNLLLQQPASINNVINILQQFNQLSLINKQTNSIPGQQFLSSISQSFANTINMANMGQTFQQLNNQSTNLNSILIELNRISQYVEAKSAHPNTYPKSFLQSFNQLLQQVSTQFGENNQALLSGNRDSLNKTQAKQFSQLMQQLNQTVSQAISNSSSQATVNPQINADLKLNIQRLLNVLQQSIASDRSQAQLTNPQNPLANSLLQHFTNPDSESHRQALPTRHKHAQVAAAQQNQLLQIANPLVFQHTLVEQLEGVMSRIVATQAATREQPDSNVNLALEIPFKFQDKSQVLQLKFSSNDDSDNKTKGKIWTANLAFELQSLGAIRIYLMLDGKKISMNFWTEELSTQKLFLGNFHHLKDRLLLAGYKIKSIHFFHGIPEEAKKEVQASKEGVIDERV